MSEYFDVPSNWYETFFTAPVNRFWEAMVPAEATAADLAFIARHVAAAPPAHVLDVPCGAGRHALGLAASGYEVTGIDLSQDAASRAALAAAGLSAHFMRSDMREFVLDEPADAAICFGNSLGYFGPEGLSAFLRRLAASVRFGGRLLLDSYSCAESIFPLQDERKIEFEGGSYRSTFCYDAMTSTLNTSAQLRLGDQVHPLLYAHRIVTSGELVRALKNSGFETLSLYADTDDAPYAPGAPRLLLVAVRE
jgi:cyclopropane fatty-acyl-phospholipid synthase-like methyltransferase